MASRKLLPTSRCLQHHALQTSTIYRPRFPTQSFGIPSQRGVSTNSLPIILQPAFWRSLLPRSLRADPDAVLTKAPPDPSKEWNPASFFIIIFLMIGSQSIQTIALQNSFDRFSTHTETKLALLRDVVKRVQAGEDIDVKGILGTGDPQKEKEWEEVMRELEQEDTSIRTRRKPTRRPRTEATDVDSPGTEKSASSS